MVVVGGVEAMCTSVGLSGVVGDVERDRGRGMEGDRGRGMVEIHSPLRTGQHGVGVHHPTPVGGRELSGCSQLVPV